MIYSARVREDVCLITQNALADHTYMSVTRDLYGDRIWIPAVCDNNAAFRQYARSGDVDFRLGRVVVQGVQQVMAINGILCKQIHEHNKWRHPFYVEESYVIPWMYPYMTPHGLALKLHPEPTALDPQLVKDDMAFWAWYTRRLTSNPDFRYDAVGRKSFSKLRSAIAGLYENRGMIKESEQAYLEAVALCPISPEAHFRLAHMYTRRGDFVKATEIMDRFQAQDPDNTRVGAFIGEIKNREKMFERMRALQKKVSSPRVNLNEVLELGQIYHRIGNIQGFIGVNQSILSNSNVPPDACMAVAKMYASAGMYGRMDTAIKKFFSRVPGRLPANVYRQIAELYAKGKKLPEAISNMEKYVGLMPVDFAAWHELGVMYLYTSRPGDALNALEQSVRIGGNAARLAIRKDQDERLRGLKPQPRFRSLLGGPV
jgi:tetratricopeptide (TPR) repeat protein